MMNLRNHRFGILALGSLLQIVGILWFNGGFFLTRIELPNKSKCDVAPHVDPTENGTWACWTRPLFRRAVVVVIDALRYDFAAWSDAEATTKKPFENKMPSIRDLLLHRPLNSLLVPFYADPPTTTMQRLKGMMTGGFPTFMEIKDDVAAEGIDITEDNFIDLLINDGTRNITFMGDDTWTVLFPNQFNRAFPYPSFNVKDLHTVDDGVLEHLIPEMKQKDWSFLVAHFLGVDHCGHRFGPDNDIMSKKLLQMNQAIDDIVHTMDQGGFEDTVLLVFGDHGMTADGNHGGATELEVGAALFVYSPKPISLGLQNQENVSTEEELSNEIKLLHPDFALPSEITQNLLLQRRPEVQQIDLAPTLALLLGLPIPFGSMGSIIPELFFVSHSNTQQTAWIERFESLNRALQVNVGQVLRYLKAYCARIGGDTQGGIISTKIIDEMWLEVETAFSKLQNAKLAFEKDEITLREFQAAHHETYTLARRVLKEASEKGRSLWTQFDLGSMALGFVTAVVGVIFLAVALLQQRVAISKDETVLCCVVFAIQMSLRLSNSFIEAEARINTWVAVSVGIFLLYRSLGYSTKTGGSDELVFFSLVFCVCSRLSVELSDAQWWRGQEAVLGDWYEAWFWGFCVVPLPILILLLVSTTRDTVARMILVSQGICAGCHWFSQAMGMVTVLKLFFPRFGYLLGVFGVLNGYSHRTHHCWQTAALHTFVSWIVPLLLLIGPASPLVLLLFVIQLHCIFMFSHERLVSAYTVAILLSMTSMSYFFSSGHESSFNKLHYAAPFVGFDEYEYYRSGLMLGFNTFGLFILIPLLIPWFSSNLEECETIVLTYIMSHACKTLVMVLFVAAQRRHLMVWRVFAPKYVFDAVTFLVVDIAGIWTLRLAQMRFANSAPKEQR